ncbi:hatching enzyme 1.2-like isoform X1 [Montipora capricornis]|uniref:hatching enzyme 1.2-like isoform X1 n=1 Tax=Montipora capricornis TaxID=246305 RepID=UPI0035F1678D
MWKGFEQTLVLLCFCYFLLPVLTRQASFGIKNGRLKGHGFYDGNKYDDGFAEYTGAEKKTFFEMQKRRFEAVEDDKGDDRRDSIDDLLLRELTRREHGVKETRDEETSSKNGRYFEFGDMDTSDEISLSEKLKDQIEDGVGTDQDDLALKREEQKQTQMETRNYLPDDGDIFEGDIVMDSRLRSWVTGQADKRDAINDVSYLWTKSEDGTVRVPYILSKEIQEDEDKLDSIKKAVKSFEKFTCIRYQPYNDDDMDYVTFKINASMCYSFVGKQGGNQDISIGNGCERLGTVLHEMMHTLGFIHEQSRPDRDKYVHVFYENIRRGMEHNFQKYSGGQVRRLPANKEFYDYDSCLHYNNHAFSKNFDDTIQSLSDPERRFGQRDFFSTHDILQINDLYGCQVSDLSKKLEDVSYQ